MNERNRNTKRLAQRVDRAYLKETFGIPRWRGILTLVFLAIGAVWLGAYALDRNQAPYTSGPLTPAHAFLGRNCAACHNDKAAVGKTVQDTACAACHNAPIHNDNQAAASLACISCHVEHRGTMLLQAKSNEGCVTCHSELKTKNGKMTIAANVTEFASHPEFAVLREKTPDPGGIRFNHKQHVGVLAQPCSACHVPSVQEPPIPAGSHIRPHTTSRPNAYITQPKYAEVCITCHALQLDDAIDAVPHDQPAVVAQFLKENLTKYIAAHPGDLGKLGAPTGSAAWITARVEKDMGAMFDKQNCGRCHESAATLTTGIPRRWFVHAAFDHSTHQQLDCGSCHAGASTSTVSSDVLIPSIQVCRNCHNSSSASAGDLCSTCHVYHDWGKVKTVEGKFKLNTN